MESCVKPEILIRLVEEHPDLWDKTTTGYKDRTNKMEAWKQICRTLLPNFDELEPWKKEEFGQLALKRWTHIRDTYVKFMKRQRNRKSSGMFFDKPIRPYIYQDNCAFLNKVIDISSAADECTSSDRIDPDDSDSTSRSHDHEESKEAKTRKLAKTRKKRNPQETDERMIEFVDYRPEDNEESPEQLPKDPIDTCKKRRLDEIDERMIQFIDHRLKPRRKDSDNRHLCFFRSLIPSLESLDDEQTLNFQIGVLSLLQDIKKRI